MKPRTHHYYKTSLTEIRALRTGAGPTLRLSPRYKPTLGNDVTRIRLNGSFFGLMSKHTAQIARRSSQRSQLANISLTAAAYTVGQARSTNVHGRQKSSTIGLIGVDFISDSTMKPMAYKRSISIITDKYGETDCVWLNRYWLSDQVL